MSETLVAQSRKTTCTACQRTVHMVPVDGSLVAVDPEVIAFVQSGVHGGTLASAKRTTGRRIHAELCDQYQREAQRAALRREIAGYKQPRKNGKRL